MLQFLVCVASMLHGGCFPNMLHPGACFVVFTQVEHARACHTLSQVSKGGLIIFYFRRIEMFRRNFIIKFAHGIEWFRDRDAILIFG